VIIKPKLRVDAGLPMRDALQRTLHQYRKELEIYILRYPDQWLGWSKLRSIGSA
jgi:hypothetical protein